MSSSALGAATCPRATRRFCVRCGMPLVAAGGEPLDEPLSEAHERARKIDPRYTEGELVRVAGGRNQAEAELIQGLLLEEGVPSILRRTAGFDVPDFLAAGPRDVMVPRGRSRGGPGAAALGRPGAAGADGGASQPGEAGGGDRARRGRRRTDRLPAPELGPSSRLGRLRRESLQARPSSVLS